MEKYLQTIHADQYTGLDDEMPDAFDNWLSELDVDDWIVLAEGYAQSVFPN